MDKELPWAYRSNLGRYLCLAGLFCLVFLLLNITMSIWIYEGPKRLINKVYKKRNKYE